MSNLVASEDKSVVSKCPQPCTLTDGKCWNGAERCPISPPWSQSCVEPCVLNDSACWLFNKSTKAWGRCADPEAPDDT